MCKSWLTNFHNSLQVTKTEVDPLDSHKLTIFRYHTIGSFWEHKKELKKIYYQMSHNNQGAGGDTTFLKS